MFSLSCSFFLSFFVAIATEKLLERIRQDQETADAVKKVVLEEEAEVKKQTKEITVLAEEAKRDLDEVNTTQ